jgi:hypothetical protein
MFTAMKDNEHKVLYESLFPLPGLLNMAMVRNFEIMLRQTLKNLCVEL